MLEFLNIIDIPGWMGDPELEYLQRMVREAPPTALIVELGAWMGRSTAALYTAMSEQQTVVTVDTWLGQPDLRYDAHREVLEQDIFLVFMELMKKLDIYPQWYGQGVSGACYLRMQSVDAASLFPDGSIDRLFIDCDHGLVGEDIDTFTPKMAPAGQISGHDHNWGNVKEQVEERLTITKVIGDVWIGSRK